MSIFTLGANQNYGALYTVPFNGVIRYEVESERPIAVMAMDATNFIAFRGARPYNYYGIAVASTNHNQQLTLPFRGQWYLVMVNYNSLPTAVHFKAWS